METNFSEQEIKKTTIKKVSQQEIEKQYEYMKSLTVEKKYQLRASKRLD